MVSTLIKKSLVLATTAATILLSVSNAHSRDDHGIGQGDDQGGWEQPCDNPYDPSCGDSHHPGFGQTEVKTVYLGRAVRNERLRLRQLAGLNERYRGYEVVAVRAHTRPNSSGRTTAQLVVDGRIVASQINPGYQINLIPNRRLVLGSTAREVLLTIDGSTQIEEIQIELLSQGGGHDDGGGYYPPPQEPNFPPHEPPPPYQPNPPQYPGDGHHPGHGSETVEVGVYRTVYGGERIDLLQYIDLNRYYGRRIQKIVITGSSQYNVALIEVLLNSFNVGTLQFTDGYRQTQQLRLNGQDLGGAASSVVLNARGNMTIERVSLVLGGY